MSTSPFVSKSMTGNTRLENDEPYSTIYIENLLGNLTDWRNIQDVVRSTFKAMCEVVRSQGVAIRELEKQITSKASKSELNSGLNIKANVADIMRTFSEVASNIENRPTMEEVQSLLDDKISKADLQYYLNSKASLEDVRHLVETKVSHAEMNSEITSIALKLEEIQKDTLRKTPTYATTKDLAYLQQQLEQKANTTDVNDALATKANKDAIINALHKKANKLEVEACLKNKVDSDEIQNIISVLNNKADTDDLDKLASSIESKAERAELSSLSNILINKAENKDFDLMNVCFAELKRDFSKRIEDIDQDVDRLIENIKKQFQNLNVVINNLEMNKVEFKDFEKLNSQISRKIDNEVLTSTVSQIKFDIYESFTHYKNDIMQNKKIFEEHINEKMACLDKNVEKTIDEFNRNKEKINEILNNRKNDAEETQKYTRQFLSTITKDLTTETNSLRNEIHKLHSEVIEQLKGKLDIKEIESIQNKFFSALEEKAEMSDLDTLYTNVLKEINSRDDEDKKNLNQILKNFENDFQRELEKKANVYDVTSMINSKADAASINVALQNKLSISEFENLRMGYERLHREVLNKVDFNKFDSYMGDFRVSIEDIQKDLMMKSNIKEIITLLKNKADIDDVNKALTQVHEELDSKCNNEQFTSAMDNQAIINDALCAENCLARWTWKSGHVKNGYAVPWEVQTVNTAPDNFLWDKDKTSVMIAAAGLYEVTMGFYADKKPTVQLLVNGEPIMSAVNSASYVVHHSSGKLKSQGKHSSGNISGLTLIDFICLPDRARISVSYSGEDGGEGFLGIRKL